MSLAPLLAASIAIQVHALAATVAFAIGLVQLAGRKGTATHRVLGYVWAGAMTLVAVSSFFIHEIRQWNGFSWIHLLSIYVLLTLPLALQHARRGNIRAHRLNMIGMFVGALVIAGLFTLLPGRIMHAVVLGR